MYKLINNIYSNKNDSVMRIEGSVLTCIPFDPANTDYQTYLKWLAEGNTPLPADQEG
jgi:hypothetical protein